VGKKYFGIQPIPGSTTSSSFKPSKGLDGSIISWVKAWIFALVSWEEQWKGKRETSHSTSPNFEAEKSFLVRDQFNRYL